MKSAWIAAAVFGVTLMTVPAYAQMAAPHAHGAPEATAVTSEIYDGQVKRISPDSARVTLAHGPLKAFNMPPMTMAFQVKDAKQLASLKVGDKVRFALEQSGENLVVTRIEPVK